MAEDAAFEQRYLELCEKLKGSNYRSFEENDSYQTDRDWEPGEMKNYPRFAVPHVSEANLVKLCRRWEYEINGLTTDRLRLLTHLLALNVIQPGTWSTRIIGVNEGHGADDDDTVISELLAGTTVQDEAYSLDEIATMATGSSLLVCGMRGSNKDVSKSGIQMAVTNGKVEIVTPGPLRPGVAPNDAREQPFRYVYMQSITFLCGMILRAGSKETKSVWRQIMGDGRRMFEATYGARLYIPRGLTTSDAMVKTIGMSSQGGSPGIVTVLTNYLNIQFPGILEENGYAATKPLANGSSNEVMLVDYLLCGPLMYIGLALVNVAIQAAEKMEMSVQEFMEHTMCADTADSLQALSAFFNKYTTTPNPDPEYKWARVINPALFQHLKPKKHRLLYYICARAASTYDTNGRPIGPLASGTTQSAGPYPPYAKEIADAFYTVMLELAAKRRQESAGTSDSSASTDTTDGVLGKPLF